MRHLVLLSLVAALACGPFAAAQPAAPPHAPGHSADLQGDPQQFMAHPRVHEFYDLSVAMLRGKASVDVGDYERKSLEIFGRLGAETGMGAAVMQEHLKLIPRQVVQIAKDDPHVLDSFDTFSEALVGPK